MSTTPIDADHVTHYDVWLTLKAENDSVELQHHIDKGDRVQSESKFPSTFEYAYLEYVLEYKKNLFRLRIYGPGALLCQWTFEKKEIVRLAFQSAMNQRIKKNKKKIVFIAPEEITVFEHPTDIILHYIKAELTVRLTTDLILNEKEYPQHSLVIGMINRKRKPKPLSLVIYADKRYFGQLDPQKHKTFIQILSLYVDEASRLS